MKKHVLLIGCIFAALAVKAQEGVTHIPVTAELRKKFAAEAKAPDSSQLVLVTPPELLKRTNPVLLAPEPWQIVTETPPSLRKRSL